MEHGLILKGVGGFYTVRVDSGEQLVAKARGRFRQQGISPLCGDEVMIERQQEGDAAIVEILPRKTELVRPPVANIDQLVIVLSVSSPKPDLMLADKLLLSAAQRSIAPLLLFNKSDTASAAQAQVLFEQYAGHYPTLIVSAHTKAGLKALGNALSGHISCFAGQSAVGKSSLLNALLPDLALPVGGMARRTGRGRHTTRHVELWPYRGGLVLDTPGFSLLELHLMDQNALNCAYAEFQNAPADCRFAACTHRSEPDCAVKALLEQGALHPERYRRYVQIVNEVEEMRKNRYG